MATHQDLLDAIARVRAVSGDPEAWKAGLSGADVAVAINPLSTPGAIGAVLAKLIAAHPSTFLPAPAPGDPPADPQGETATAITGAESALAQQQSAAEQVDLRVLGAVLNAHSTHAGGVVALERLHHEVESAAAARGDLDNPAGARAFQGYLADKLREIRAIVETAGLDAESKAGLAAALTALYQTAAPESVAGKTDPDGDSRSGSESETTAAEEGSCPEGEPFGEPGPAAGEQLLDPALLTGEYPAGTLSPDMPAPPMPAMASPAPAWGGGLPAGPGFGGGPAGMPGPLLPSLPPDRSFESPEPEPESEPEAESEAEPDSESPPPAADSTIVELPSGETITAPSPKLAAVITAAVAGTPIPEAFRLQGITIPAPGSTVAAPVDTPSIVPGDIGVLADRHALALGNGTALLDNLIQPVTTVMGPGFLGWQHPPAPESAPTSTAPEPRAPTRPAEPAPS